MVLMWSKALNLSLMDGRSDAEMGLRRSNDLWIGGGATALRVDLGLDPVLGFPFGLKVAACGLGRNSLLFGFNLPPCALVTPLDRREKLESTLLAGPVGGSLASCIGIGFIGIWCLFCSMFLNRATKFPGARFC